MRRTGHESGSSLRRTSRGAAALLALVAIVAACAAPGAGTSNPPAATSGPTTAVPSTAPASMAAGLTLELATVPTHGSVLVGEGGKSLYVFLNDAGGTSACVDACATAWPPLTVTAASDVSGGTGVTGPIATIERADGTLQVTLGGAPLYYFANDAAAGETKGQGLNDVWYLVSAAGEPVGQAAASPDGGQPTPTICTGRSCY
jgi:predicted lipoprotein with Yx(FWY)xxD motif